MTLSYTQIKYLIKVLKAMKCDSYLLDSTKIIGWDKYNTTLTEVNDIYTGLDIVDKINIEKEEIKTLEDTVKAFVGAYPDKYAEANYIKLLTYRKFGNYYSDCRPAFSSLYITYNNQIDYSVDLRKDAEFEACLNLKAKDGARIYKYKSPSSKIYPISIFSGLLPVNKSDKVYLQVIEENNGQTFICKFIINKGFIEINKYIKYMMI